MYGGDFNGLFAAMMAVAAVVGWAIIEGLIWLIKLLVAHLAWVP